MIAMVYKAVVSSNSANCAKYSCMAYAKLASMTSVKFLFLLLFLFRMLLVRVYRTNFRVPFNVSMYGNGLRDGG